MSPTEAIPLLIVVLLLASVGGQPDRMVVTFGGDQRLDAVEDVHVVAGGTTTVPAGVAVSGDVYAIGGSTRVAGTVDGDVTVLAGTLTVADGATITGTLRTIAGESTVAPGATVGEVAALPPAPEPSPARRAGTFLLQFLVLGAAGGWLASRRPRALGNVGHAVTEHALVSGVVGALAAATLLVLFVYMALTILLIPLSIAGLAGILVIVAYGQVVYGHLIGRRLPVDRPGRATVAGVGLFLLALEALEAVPYVGALVELGLVAVAFGAVLDTYFGLQRFEPVPLPGGETR